MNSRVHPFLAVGLFTTIAYISTLATTSAQSIPITLDVHDSSFADVIALLAAESGFNIVLDDSVKPERVTLHLQNVSFDEALSVLAQSHGLQITRMGSVLVLGAHAPPAPKPREQRTQVYKLQYERATDVVKLLKELVPATAAGTAAPMMATADDTQNAIFITGTEAVQRTAEAFLRRVDVPSPQVLFEVRVADVEPINESSAFGLEFGGVDLSGNPLTGAATYSFSSPTVSVNARLDALASEGHAQILATPKLLTLNNHEATMLIGETYPITYQTSAFSGQAVQFVDIGVKLRLTPTIGTDGSVTAELHPEYSEIEGMTSADLPIIANRKIDSTLRVESDQTIVLGGLFSDTDSTTITKIPGLSQIPILGKFFQDKSTQHQRSEIVFLITPHVIYPGQTPPSK